MSLLRFVNPETQWIPIDLIYYSLPPIIRRGTEIQKSLLNSQHNLKDMAKHSIQLNIENHNIEWYLLNIPS